MNRILLGVLTFLLISNAFAYTNWKDVFAEELAKIASRTALIT